MMSSDVIIDTVPCLPYRRHLVPVPSSSRIGYRMIPPRNPSHAIPDTTASASASLLSSPIASLIALLLPAPLPASPCRPTGRSETRRNPTRYSSRLVSSRLACSYRLHLIGSSVPPVACLPRPTHAVAIHLIHLISLVSSHRLIARISSPAQSDETSDEQAKRRTARSIDNRKAERHDIRYLPDTANAPPRPPYSPYKPNNARIPTRTRPWENDPSTSLTTPQTGRQRNDGRDETTGRRLLAYRHDNEATTLPPASRHEQRNAERHGELLPAPRHDNTGRTTGRTDCEMRDGTRGGTKKRAANLKERRPEKQDEI